MGPADFAGDEQAQSQARRRPFLVQLQGELDHRIEDGFEVAFRDGGAAILHVQEDFLGLAPKFQADVVLLVPVLRGVGQQVGKQLLDS